MRKWCPDNFAEAASPGTDQQPARPPVRDFASLVPELPVRNDPADFEADPILSGRRSLWDLLSESEQEDLRTEARQVLEVELARRTAEAAERQQAERDNLRREFDERFTTWTEEFAAALRRDEQEFAREAAQLALAVARKIIRDTVEIDPGLVVRSLETALYKVGDASSLTVSLHPDDVPLLDQDDQLRTRLRIGTIVPDRRVDRGGCRIKAGAREWDATVTGQLDALAQVVSAAMDSSADHDLQPGADDDLLA